jgi:hypothetical protein
MTPGVSGLEVLRRLLRAGKFADLKATMPDAVADFYEPPLTPGGWHSGAGGSFFTVDARRAGLAAAGVAELAPFALEYSDNRRHFEDRAGWVLIERGPWNETRMPDPVGPRSEGAVIWVTTATLNLLQELQAAGVYEIVRIYESYTAPSRRVLRKWSEIINTTYMNTYAGNPELAPPDLNAISAAAKDVGRETIGMFDSKNGASTRSDWFHTINAVKRCNIWRKAWHLGRTADIWPRFLDDDTIAYSARPYTEQFLAAFPEGEALGRWRWQQHPIG